MRLPCSQAMERSASSSLSRALLSAGEEKKVPEDARQRGAILAPGSGDRTVWRGQRPLSAPALPGPIARPMLDPTGTSSMARCDASYIINVINTLEGNKEQHSLGVI